MEQASRRRLALMLTAALLTMGADRCGSSGGGAGPNAAAETPPPSDGLQRWTAEWARRIRENPDLRPEDVIPPPLPEWPGEPPPEAMAQAQQWVLVCTNGVPDDDPFAC